MEARRIRPHFDVDFYLDAHPDVRASGMDPVRHYVAWGWREGRDPHPDFSTRGWIAKHPEVHVSGRNPYLHFLTAGSLTKPERPGHDQVARAIGAEFDAGWYLERNPDVAASDLDPLRHFILHGAREGRNPNAEFSTSYYLAANPDVAQAGLNPFWHYVVAGRAEGRAPTNPGGERLEALSALRPLEAEVAEWKARGLPPDPLSDDALRAAIAASAGPTGRVIVTLGHDNYREHSGGVQLCIQFEEQMARRAGLGFVNFHPHQPLMRLARRDAEDERLLTVMIDGTRLGTVTPEAALTALGEAREIRTVDVVIHSLLGHTTEFAEGLLDLDRRGRALFWAHDHFLLCPNYLLQRNSIVYCDAPPPASQACGICKFGAERTDHLARLQSLLARPGITIVSPSDWQADFLRDKAPFALPPTVSLPHASLTRVDAARAQSREGPIRVAFAGAPVRFKGWTDFMALSEKLTKTRLAEFHAYGSGTAPHVRSTKVSVTSDDQQAMSDALAADDIDLVLVWAHWPETFSFVAHEAMVAGAFVVTNERTGNVAELVRETGCGVVLDFETDLAEWLASDDCAALVERRRRARSETFALSRSGKSIDLLLDEDRG